jgi:hypothetical protein
VRQGGIGLRRLAVFFAHNVYLCRNLLAVLDGQFRAEQAAQVRCQIRDTSLDAQQEFYRREGLCSHGLDFPGQVTHGQYADQTYDKGDEGSKGESADEFGAEFDVFHRDLRDGVVRKV